MNTLRPYASRIAGLLVGTLCSWLLVRFGFDMPADLREGLNDLIVAAFLGGATYITTHFAVATKVNPDDAASPHAAALGKAKQVQRKAARTATENSRKGGLWRAVDEPPVEPIDRGE